VPRYESTTQRFGIRSVSEKDRRQTGKYSHLMSLTPIFCPVALPSARR
jgi:hypothetical protein